MILSDNLLRPSRALGEPDGSEEKQVFKERRAAVTAAHSSFIIGQNRIVKWYYTEQSQ